MDYLNEQLNAENSIIDEAIEDQELYEEIEMLVNSGQEVTKNDKDIKLERFKKIIGRKNTLIKELRIDKDIKLKRFRKI